MRAGSAEPVLETSNGLVGGEGGRAAFVKAGERERWRGQDAARRDGFERVVGRRRWRTVVGEALDVPAGREHDALLGGVGVTQMVDAVVRGFRARDTKHECQRGRDDATVAPDRPREGQRAEGEQQDEGERGRVPVMMRAVRAGGRGGEGTRGIRQVSEHHGPNHTLVAQARNRR